MSDTDIDARDRLGRTDLLWAAWMHGPEATRQLLEQGADINARDSYQWTPLMVAVRAGQTEMVRLLLTHGAEITGVDVHGTTVLTMALDRGDEEIAQLLQGAGAKEPALIVAARKTGANAIPTLRVEKETYTQEEHIRYWIGVRPLTRTPIPESLRETVRLHVTQPDGTIRTELRTWPRDGAMQGGWEGGWGFGSTKPEVGTYTLVYEFAGLQTEPATLVIVAS